MREFLSKKKYADFRTALLVEFGFDMANTHKGLKIKDGEWKLKTLILENKHIE